MTAPNGSLQTEWFKTYGSTVRYHGMFCEPILLTQDPATVHYIHQHSDIFLQPDATRSFSLNTMGRSLTAVEGQNHQRQRRAIAPSFGPTQIPIMTPTMLDKANRFVDVLEKRLGMLDIVPFIQQLAVDVIGSTAFGYDIDSLTTEGNELLVAWRRMMTANMGSGILTMIQRAGIPLANLWVCSTPGSTLTTPAHRETVCCGRCSRFDARDWQGRFKIDES